MNNNLVDFFQPQSNDLSVASAGFDVYLDGRWCDFLVAEKITFAGDDDFNQAIFSYHSTDNRLLMEEVDSVLWPGQKIVVKSVYDAGIGKPLPRQLPIFAGTIEKVKSEISDSEHRVEVIAKDFSAKFDRRTVYGRNICLSDGRYVSVISADTVFNPSSGANGSLENIVRSGRSYKAFAAEQSGSQLFSLADAIYYLLCNFTSADELVIPTISQLDSLTENANIFDVDVTALSLTDALRRCCRLVGLRFKFVPNLADVGPAEAIVFYRPGRCRQIEVNCQWPGQKLDFSKTSIAGVLKNSKYLPVTNRYIVQGDYKTYEATFELVKAWDSSLEENNYEKFSPVTNEDFSKVSDVYRKWSLNEAGDYRSSPYNRGEAFDFSLIFENTPYVQKKRRFLPAITKTLSGSSLGYYLEVSYVNGSHWWPYMGSFKILTDQCGIWLSGEQLDMNLWFAVLKGVLKFRITASVASDERINYIVSDGPVNSTAEVVDKIITLPSRFKYRKVTPASVFANADQQDYSADIVDDTSALVEYGRNILEANFSQVENLRIKTLLLSPIFSPGDQLVTGPDSRNILGLKYDNTNFCRLEKIELDFINQQSILTAVKRRK